MDQMRRISGSGFKGWPRPVSLCAAILMSAATWTPLAAEGLNVNQQRAFDIYKELIEINTVTARGATAKAAEARAARRRAGGFPDVDVHAFSPAPRKGNLVARLRGTGARKPILLLAHIDVVPASREDWSTDPFKLIEQDGYFYARGSGDDKYMAAAFIANLIRYRQEGYKPDRDIIVALETDEEILDKDALGIQWLLKNHRDLIDAELALHEGGNAINALPQLASAKINCRIMPGEPVDGVKATLERVLADDQIAVKQIDQATLSAPSALSEGIIGPITQLSAEFFPGAVVLPTMSAGATDGSYLRNAGIP